MVALYTVWDNCACIDKALRVSPAMAAGISDRLWSMEDVAALVEAADAKLGNGDRMRSDMLKLKPWHVATAAEAIVAAQFARFGYDVSVQYGANQPEYDLMIAEGERMLKVSVKGSQDGGWGLTQTQLSKIKNADYHGAAELWFCATSQ